VYVAGSNAENDYGTFSIATDNQYISNYLSANGYVAGDLTGDGVVSGDGSGGPGDDVAMFIAGWNSRKEFEGFRVGDLETRLEGDFNFDGVVDLADWGTLRDNHVNGASLNLS